MKTISIFDVIGPNMIGPSSSHTAGALKIALFARQMCEGKIVKVHFLLYGSFAQTYLGHGTDRALVAGILGFGTEDLRIRDSFTYAKKAGLLFSFSTNSQTTDIHPNTVDISLTNDMGELTTVTGISIGGGNIEIRKLNNVEINFTGEYCTILVPHRDKPGVAAHITRCLANNKINIASLRLYRESKGMDAYCIAEADETIDRHVLTSIKKHPDVLNAILINR